jgi:hypothetical protein
VLHLKLESMRPTVAKQLERELGVPMKLDMDEILSETSLFEAHFCSPTTIRNLRNIPTETLRRTVQELYKYTGCNIFASPRLWTPVRSEQCVIVSGSLDISGRTRGDRFGLCVDTQRNEKGDADAIYLWANGTLLKQAIAHGKISPDYSNKWVGWRVSSEKTLGKYIRLSQPIAYQHEGEWSISTEDVDGDLRSFLSTLKERHAPNAKILSALTSTFKLFGHSRVSITPFLIDFYRHPDEDSSDTDVEFDNKRPKRVVIGLAQSEEERATNKRPAASAGGSSQRKVTTARFEAKDLFSVEPKDPPAASLPFMDTAFRCLTLDQEPFKAGGLYGIFFKETVESKPNLIYVGLFRNGKIGSGPVFEGNVLKTRWIKHIATCSLRGEKVGIGSRTAQLMRLDPEHPLSSLGDPRVADIIVKDTGCNAGENRTLFAKERWSTLGKASRREILSYFSFSYVRLNALHGLETDDDIRKRICNAENEVKKRLAPVCNRETIFGQHSTDVTKEQFEAAARVALNRPDFTGDL